MAHIATTHTFHSGLFGRVRNFFADLREAGFRHAEYRRTFKELSALSDRELQDIGICRGDILDIARYHLDRI